MGCTLAGTKFIGRQPPARSLRRVAHNTLPRVRVPKLITVNLGTLSMGDAVGVPFPVMRLGSPSVTRRP